MAVHRDACEKLDFDRRETSVLKGRCSGDLAVLEDVIGGAVICLVSTIWHNSLDKYLI
jgi:hypothetical protein